MAKKKSKKAKKATKAARSKKSAKAKRKPTKARSAPRKATKKTKKAKKARRTVLYSSKGKKLYAVRDAEGHFKDIQQYSRAHAMDIQRTSAAEVAAAPPAN